MSCPKPSLKLFVSVDVIDSTAFKNKRIEHGISSSNWLKDFRLFYEDFPVVLQQAYNKLDNNEVILDENFNYPFQWKLLGDEIVFVVDIVDFDHAYIHLEAFKKAIQLFNSSKILKLKATAWLAGFPVVNAIIYDKDTNSDIGQKRPEIQIIKSVDFIGPSIDLGFRIAKFSDRRKFVISIDLAYILLDYFIRKNISPYYIFFDKHQDAKGLRNNKYPVVWIDNYDGHEPIEDELYGLSRKSSNYNLLHDYCKKALEHDEYKLLPPFTENHPDLKPCEYDTDYKNVCEMIYRDIEDSNDGCHAVDVPNTVGNKGDFDSAMLALINELRREIG